MKLIGHAWVAVNAVPQGKRKLLILGSILPEIMYYTRHNPFSFEEIHEGGEKVYQYLLKRKPKWADLGLGMITHSFGKGADKFNLDDQLAFLGYEGEMIDKLRMKLSSILGVDYETTKTRAHNIIELAVDLGIIKNRPDFIDEFMVAVEDKNTKEEIKSVLVECFDKPQVEVSKAVNELFGKIKSNYLGSAESLAYLWQELSSAIPDPKPDIKRLTLVINELSVGFAGRDQEFLKRIIHWTKSNIEGISVHPERKNN